MAVRVRRKRSEPLAAPPPASDQSPKYQARKDLEDAIAGYAMAYASYCMHTAPKSLIERMEQVMFDAIDALERACQSSEGSP